MKGKDEGKGDSPSSPIFFFRGKNPRPICFFNLLIENKLVKVSINHRVYVICLVKQISRICLGREPGRVLLPFFSISGRTLKLEVAMGPSSMFHII